jgi:hypothetical protein
VRRVIIVVESRSERAWVFDEPELSLEDAKQLIEAYLEEEDPTPLLTAHVGFCFPTGGNN